MPDPLVLLVFLPAALALNLTPGVDMLFCLAQGMKAGPRPALAASAGISTGTMVHVALAGLGLGALVTAFPWLFGAIRWLGAAYLLWLAWRALTEPLGHGHAPPARPARAFRDGLVVNLSNPKMILFILAFVPQFVDPSDAVLRQFLAFGAVLAAGGFVVNGIVGIFAGRLGRRLASSPRLENGLRGVTATLFGALALRMGWEAARG